MSQIWQKKPEFLNKPFIIGDKKAREEGHIVPGDGINSEWRSSAGEFSVVLDSAAMSEAELSAYCRSKELYPDQVADWRAG